VELIDDEVTRLAALVDDLLASASATQEVVVLDRAPTDVQTLLQAAARRFEGAAREREVQVTIAAASDLPRIYVDAARMHQVIGNLVANALAHAPRGSAVALSASVPFTGHGVMLSVTNAGPGIEPSRLPTVFEAFAQGKRPTGSVGLGLTIVREFVRAHGGTVDVSSGSWLHAL